MPGPAESGPYVFGLVLLKKSLLPLFTVRRGFATAGSKRPRAVRVTTLLKMFTASSCPTPGA